MPDGDIFHVQLKSQYQKPYKMLCEQKCSLEELEKAILNAIRSRIKKAGITTIDQIEIMACAISQALSTDALGKEERCKLANKAIDEVLYNNTLAPRLSDLICNAAKKYIHDIRYGILDAIGYENEQIMKRFFNEILNSEFNVPITQQKNHHNNANHEVINKQLESISPGIKNILLNWAKKVTKNKHLKHLQLPRNEKNPVNLDENLL